ncbi:MAG: stage V sporulation protein AD [Firmicutes bacterium]|nr:stage V sporulation protein AD [Bacillota bacterium]
MERGQQQGKRTHDITKPNKKGKSQTIIFERGVSIIGGYSIVGKKEGQGPLGKTFSKIVDDEYFGEKTHEGAEQKMFEHAIRGAIKDANITQDDVDMMMSGDLLNQIISSSFAARTFDMIFLGIYGACSTMALTLGVGACFIEGGFMKNIVVSAGSHFASAERQYRTPLELGNQRPPTSQWTVTGVGANVLTKFKKGNPKITAVTFGKVYDWGVSCPNNMGAAMAPAAAHTIIAHFIDTKTKPSDYDHIFTGDLGKHGENILRDLLANANYPVAENYSDCGRMIYDLDQNQYQGGSGCGCSAVILNGFIMDKLKKGEYKKILFVGTGALLSPISSWQGETIPAIAHAVVIEN